MRFSLEYIRTSSCLYMSKIMSDPHLRELASKEKAKLIDALREIYPLKKLEMSKSSYFYQKEVSSKPDKYADLRKVVKWVFNENLSRYGYRSYIP